MKRKRLIRFQLLLLCGVAVLLFWRMSGGPAKPAGLLAVYDIEVGKLAARTFVLDSEALVHIAAIGSVEAEGGGRVAAYGWLLNRATREVVWLQEAKSSEFDRTLMVTADSVLLPEGAYDVYFTSFGETESARGGRAILGLRTHWTNDAKEWMIAVSVAEGVGQEISFEAGGWDTDALWSTGAVGNRARRSTRLQVQRETEVRVYSIAELCRRGCDSASIKNVVSGDVVWELKVQGSAPAGGLDRNRAFDGTVTLAPGIYEMKFQTDRRHAARAWRANPPFDPLAWGMRVYADSEDVSEFDPWYGPDPIVSFREVGNDANLEAELLVVENISVVLVSTGESGSGSSDILYDYAWLEKEGSSSRVWEMTVDASGGAGGDNTNKVETAFLELGPGRYFLHYVSDGSHAFGDFRRSEPDVPARWGVTMFPLVTPEGAVVLVDQRSRAERSSPTGTETGILSPLPDASRILFQATSLGNDSERETTLSLDEKTRIRVIAVGEISESDQYDYGWIENVGKRRIWEMTRDNTRPAGGNDINRIFDGELELDPGDYRIHFETDFSHAFGDFGGGGPADEGGWGIRVYRVDE